MPTLYKRATMSQRAMLRIIEGAVKNASDAHPGAAISQKMARSIAKRAAGTLTAKWPEVLAAKAVSKRPCGDLGNHGLRNEQDHAHFRGSRRPASTGRAPIPGLVKWLSSQVYPAKKAGHFERAEALISVLRKIHEIKHGSA